MKRLTAAGNKPEAHIYSAGGHGFGMKKQGTTERSLDRRVSSGGWKRMDLRNACVK